MLSHQTLPPPPPPSPPPPLGGNPRRARPEAVDLCYRAALDGDLDGVKEQVWRLLHNPDVANAVEKPHPGWLFMSLLQAISQDNVEMVQFLLDEGVADGCPQLEPAVRSRAFGVLELLLRNGTDINQPINRSEPPVLSIPICTNDKEMVTWLLDHGADPNCPCSWDCTPASLAMYTAPIELIEYLFQRGADPLHGELLQWAVIRNKPNGLDIVRQIVEKGAPIDEIKYAKDPESYYQRKPWGLGTPLHRAAECGKVDIVKYLLEMGANPLKLDSKGRTPRFWAEKNDATEVVQILKEAEEIHVLKEAEEMHILKEAEEIHVLKEAEEGVAATHMMDDLDPVAEPVPRWDAVARL